MHNFHEKFWNLIEQGNKEVFKNEFSNDTNNYIDALKISRKQDSEIYTIIACLYIGEASVYQQKYDTTIEALQKAKIDLFLPRSRSSHLFSLLVNIIETIIGWIKIKQYAYIKKAYRYFMYITIFTYFDCCSLIKIQSNEQEYTFKYILKTLKLNNYSKESMLKIITGKTNLIANKPIYLKILQPYLKSKQKKSQNVNSNYQFQIYRSLAVICEQLGLFAEAAESYRWSLKHLPFLLKNRQEWKAATTIRMNCCHALVEYRKGNIKQVIKYANAVLKVKIDHKTPESVFFRKVMMHLLLCKIYANQRLYKESVCQYEKMKATSDFIKDAATKKILQPYTNDPINAYIKILGKEKLYKNRIPVKHNKDLDLPEIVLIEILAHMQKNNFQIK